MPMARPPGGKRAAAEHRAQLEQVQRQHRIQLDAVQTDLADVTAARDGKAELASALKDIQVNILHPLLVHLVHHHPWRPVLVDIFAKAGYNLTFDTPGASWSYEAKPEPAPVRTPQPESRDRSTGPAR